MYLKTKIKNPYLEKFEEIKDQYNRYDNLHLEICTIFKR